MAFLRQYFKKAKKKDSAIYLQTEISRWNFLTNVIRSSLANAGERASEYILIRLAPSRIVGFGKDNYGVLARFYLHFKLWPHFTALATIAS